MTNANALPIQDALAELRGLTACRCDDAYTGRGLHDPTCECDSKDAVEAIADRIDALEAALELADARFHMHGMTTMTQRLEEYGYEHEAQVHDLDAYRAALVPQTDH